MILEKSYNFHHFIKLLDFVRAEGRQLGEPAVRNIALSLMDFWRAGLSRWAALGVINISQNTNRMVSKVDNTTI